MASMDDKQAHTFGMLCHLLGLFTWFIGPLIIWMLKKEEHPFIDQQGKEALNFQISWLVYFLAAGILTVIVIGALLMPVLSVAGLVLIVMACIKTSKGEAFKYPLIFRLIK